MRCAYYDGANPECKDLCHKQMRGERACYSGCDWLYELNEGLRQDRQTMLDAGRFIALLGTAMAVVGAIGMDFLPAPDPLASFALFAGGLLVFVVAVVGAVVVAWSWKVTER